MRKKSGLTQVQLGIKLNIANNTISQYEKGRRGTDNETLKLFADYFHISIQDILFADLQKEHANKDIRISSEKIIQLLNLLFPLIKSKSALLNEDFCKGYKYSEAIQKYGEEAFVELAEEINKRKEKAKNTKDIKEIIEEVFGRNGSDDNQKYLSMSYDCFKKIKK